MLRLFKKIRHQLLSEDNFATYFLYAIGEVLLVVIGILLALQIDNWNQKRIQKQVEIENIENLFLSFNEDISVEGTIFHLERAVKGELAWIDYLEGNTPYHDSLLDYGYYIGATTLLTPNLGFYESLKQKGLETLENKYLRNQLSLIYEQNFQEIITAMDHFNDLFGQDRIRYFRKYFTLSMEINEASSVNFLQFDYSLYRIKELLNLDEMSRDREFIEFVRISLLFHQNTLLVLDRLYSRILRVKTLISQELNFLEYGSPERRKVTLVLEGYGDAESVQVSGDFNNWRPDQSMLHTPEGWVQSFDLFPGIYEYKFILNGDHWIKDPANPDSVYVPEVLSHNSVLTVPE